MKTNIVVFIYKILLSIITVFLCFTCNTVFASIEFSRENSGFIKSSETYGKGHSKSEILEDLELSFSHKRKLYIQAFELSISSNNPGATIYYTTDCSMPSTENASIYSGSIPIDSTTIVKAMAVASNGNSRIYTNSYFFPESTARQGKIHNGFPEMWGGAKTIEADYEMDPEVINDPAYASEIQDAFQSLPTLSLTMDTDEWFNHETGLYVGYPNTNETREKPVTAEFIFNTDTEENFVVECGVQNQGGTSIVKWKSPKQSMRLLFKEIYGPTRLRKKLFPDAEINSINTLVVDAMLNATWIHPKDSKQRLHALYMRDQLTSDLQNEMGWLSFHGRYFHLYLNGLYWGICDLHERPDDAFLSEYLDAEREDFDIIKHKPDEIVSGSNAYYMYLLNIVRTGSTSASSDVLESLKPYLDIPAFIDYMILNFYMGNQDWSHHNWYAGKNKKSGIGFRFYPWDSEHTMRYADVNYNNTLKNNEGGPTEIHTLLKANEEYRVLFGDAVYKHLFNEGALTPANFEKNFKKRAGEIEKAIILESARWGDYREDVSQTTYTKNDYWIPERDLILENYIPNRRDIVIKQLGNSKNNLFPGNMPPTVEEKEKTDGGKEITLTNSNHTSGSIYFTLDGTDPRLKGGSINGIKYEGKISIDGSTILKARFYSEADDSWSALAEEIYLYEDNYGGKMVISEIMYHPDDDYPEFIEIMNFGSSPVNLNGFTFKGGINYLFQSDQIIQPGAGLVLSDDNTLFRKAYKYNAFGQYEKRLSNSGETIILNNGFDQLVDSVAYSDSIPWPDMADGSGYSLELIEATLDNALASSWKVSDKLFGTPYNSETKQELNATMYPNPFRDIVTIVLDDQSLANQKFKIDVFNQIGSMVKTFQKTSYNSKLEIELAGMLPGMYFIQVNAEGNSQFKGIVLKAIKLN